MNTDRVMRWSGRRAYVYGWLYRQWSILIHRYGYHHTRTLYPASEKGVTPTLKCDWCGLSAKRPATTDELIRAVVSEGETHPEPLSAPLPSPGGTDPETARQTGQK